MRQIDGGRHYFSRFSNAAGWDSPAFYPLAVFNQTLGYVPSLGTFTPGDITAYKNEGINGFINLYNGYNQALINAIRARQMWVLAPPLAPPFARNTINGYFWFDEAEANNHCNRLPQPGVLGEAVSCSPTSLGGTPARVIAEVTAALHGAYHAGDRTRFVYGNYTKPVARNEGLTATEASQYISAVDVVSFDDYIINDGWERDHNLWEQYDLVRHVRAEGNFRRPVLVFVEAGEPFPSDQWSGVTATPAMSVAEAWNAIIAGARGIEWFDHDFGGKSAGYADSSQGLIDTNPVFASLRAAVRSFDLEVSSLAPVLNAPFAQGLVRTSGAVNLMAKYDRASNEFYIFAASRSDSAQTIRFSVRGAYTGPVQVYGEKRSVIAAHGSFTDKFADAKSVHVYVVPNG